MAGRRHERSLEAPRRAELVAEYVCEEPGCLVQELRGDRRGRRLDALALRHGLESEGQLARAAVAQGRRVQALPRVRRKHAPRQRREDRVEQLLLVLHLGREREGGRIVVRSSPPPRRLLCHGVT